MKVDVKVMSLMMASKALADAMQKFNDAARPVAQDSDGGRIDYHNRLAARLLHETADALRLVSTVAGMAADALTPPDERDPDPDAEAENAAGA